MDDPPSWSSRFDQVQYVINNTYHTSLKATPSKLLLRYELLSHSDARLIDTLNKIANIELNCEQERDASRELANVISNKIRNYNKIYYDKHHKKFTNYKIGDYVLIRDTGLKPDKDKKLKPNYKGLYQIAKVLNNHRYVVQDIPGFNITQSIQLHFITRSN